MGKIRTIEHDDVLKELQKLSPVLAGMPKVNPFKVPEEYFERVADKNLPPLEKGQGVVRSGAHVNPFKVPMGYFEEMPGRLVEQLTGDDPELGDELQHLHDNRTDFTVPPDYFEKLSDRVMNNVRLARTTKVRPIGFRFRVVAVAASLVGAVLMILPLMTQNHEDVAVSRDDVSDYMLANLEDFTEAEIVEFIGEEAMLEIVKEEAMVNDVELKNYLLDEVDYYQFKDEWL